MVQTITIAKVQINDLDKNKVLSNINVSVNSVNYNGRSTPQAVIFKIVNLLLILVLLLLKQS